MFKRTIDQLIEKAKKRILTGLHQEMELTRDSIKGDLNENNRLIREFIIEQRKREDNNLFGGTFQVSETALATKIFNGLIMYLDPRDIAVVPHIILEGIWEKSITIAWLAILDKQKTVLDIGANFGYFGMITAQKLSPKHSNVIMFEANSALVPYINKTLSVNWLNENTTVENLAVSDKNGTVSLNVLHDYTGSSSVNSLEHLESYLHHKMEIKADRIDEVKAISIDSYCSINGIEAVDLIKMDIEGYEEKAYGGMRRIVAASPNIIMFIEFTKDGYQNPKKFYEQMLADFGNIYLIKGDGHFIVPPETTYEGITKNTDDWVMFVFSKVHLLDSENTQATIKHKSK